MVAVKTGFTPPPVPGMPAPMQPMMPMGGAPARNPFAPMPPMPLAGMPPPPAQPPMAQQFMPQMQQQGSNAPRRKRFGDSLEGMLSRNQGLGSMAAQRRPLPMPPQMMPQQRMVAPGTPMMRTPTPRPMNQGGIVQYFDAGGHAHPHPQTGMYDDSIANSVIANMVAGRDDLSDLEKLEFANSLAATFGVTGGAGQTAAIDNVLNQALDISSDLSDQQRLDYLTAAGDASGTYETGLINALTSSIGAAEAEAAAAAQAEAERLAAEAEAERLAAEAAAAAEAERLAAEQAAAEAAAAAAAAAAGNGGQGGGNNGQGLDGSGIVDGGGGSGIVGGIDTTGGAVSGNVIGTNQTVSPSSLGTASLFGPSINIPQPVVSQFVQNPVANTITTTGGPYMTAISPIGAINLPARPVDIDIFDYLGEPTYGSLLDKPVDLMAQGGSVQGFDMGGHAHPHSNNSSIGPSGYTSLDAIADAAVQADDDKSFTHMGKSYDNVRDFHDAIFGDDDDDDKPISTQAQINNPNVDGPMETILNDGRTSIGSAGTLGDGGGGSSSAPPPPPTPVVYKDIYGRTHSSQARADAANRLIMQQQSSSDKPDRTIDKEIAGPDLAFDDALALTQGVIPPQFSGAVPPGSQFSYGNIGGIGDTSSGFNLPPAVVDPDVGGTAQTLGLGLDSQTPDSISNIINLNAPVSGTTYPNAPPPGTGTTTASTTSGIQPASNTTVPDNTTSIGYFPEDPGTGFPSSGTTAQNLNQGLGNVKPKPRPNTGNQGASTKDTTGASQYRPSVNAAEAEYLQNLLGQFEFDDQGKMVFAEPGVVEKVINQIVRNLSLGLIDLEDLDNQKVQAVLDAYEKTGKFAYDSEGNAINLETIADLEKLERLSSGSGIEPAVTGVYDSEGNIVSYGPDIKNTKDGPVVVSNVDIFGSGSSGGGSDTGGDTGVDTGHTVDEDGNIVCNTPGYIYNPETKVCEPAKESDGDLNLDMGSGVSNRSFEDVLANVVIPAPDIAPISANIRPMKMGGMAGLNRAADNFIKALAG